MILLDTNVVSEVLRHDGSTIVRKWLRQRPIETVYLAAPSLAELMTGIEIMPDGRKKSILFGQLGVFLKRRLANHVLSFDEPAAEAYAQVIARARSRGHAVAPVDGQIAAIARVHGLQVVSRDSGPFIAGGVAVINPWVDDLDRT